MRLRQGIQSAQEIMTMTERVMAIREETMPTRQQFESMEK